MIRTATVIAALLGAAPALASTSNVVETNGAQIRLVSAGVPAVDGSLEAVLEIALEPGWKTYWLDPGEAGVPPSLTLADTGDAVPLLMPAPVFVEEGGATLAGYDRSVRFVAKLADGGKPLEADVFIGICEKICVPVSGRLSLDPASDPDNARDAAIVEEAKLALPGAPDAEFRADPQGFENGTLRVNAVVPPDAGEAALFVASQGEWMFSQSAQVAVADRHAVFDVAAISPADGVWPADGFLYVLVANGRAVEGRLSKP
jgi:DsbC/DsbD-like thiol-disulfide interchange protein